VEEAATDSSGTGGPIVSAPTALVTAPSSTNGGGSPGSGDPRERQLPGGLPLADDPVPDVRDRGRRGHRDRLEPGIADVL
jgi:hypothetical protein